MEDKGKEAVASLMGAGIRPGGLNPICGAEIWKSVEVLDWPECSTANSCGGICQKQI